MNIRGHHLVCTYCFHGSGKEKAEDFFGVKNAIPQLWQTLRQNPDIKITVAADLDDVCDQCHLRKPDGCGRGANAFEQNEKLRGWDRAILKALGLREGDTIAAKALEARIRNKIPDISRYCPTCASSSPSGWKEYRRAIRKGLWPKEASRPARTRRSALVFSGCRPRAFSGLRKTTDPLAAFSRRLP